jgi:uncharacterized protein
LSIITSETQSASSIAAPNWVQRHPLVAYFVIAFAGMWALVIPLALSSGFHLFSLPDPVLMLLFILNPYPGPLLGAFVVIRATEGRAGVSRLLKRIIQWRVNFRWYLAAIFSILLIWLAAYSIIYSGAPLQALIANPLLLVTVLLPNILLGLFIPSLGEEVGWRGFALPRLQGQYGPVMGTLILGILHALWHLPALFTANFGPLPPQDILPFLLSVVGTTFLYSWVTNGARGSILIAILMHAASNAASTLLNVIVPWKGAFPAPFQALTLSWLNVILFSLAAVILVGLTRGRLGYQAKSG